MCDYFDGEDWEGHDSDTLRGADASVSNTLNSCVPPRQEHGVIDPRCLSLTFITVKGIVHPKIAFSLTLYVILSCKKMKSKMNKMSTCLRLLQLLLVI